MKISKEEAIKILSRYDTEYYTPATRQTHRMAVEALREQESMLVRVAELETELRLAKEQLQESGCDYCKHERLEADEHPCNECVNAGGRSGKWEWRKPEPELVDNLSPTDQNNGKFGSSGEF